MRLSGTRAPDHAKIAYSNLLVPGEITTPQSKDMTGVSRKFLLPLIEYFDSKKVTLRIGDIRKLRKV